MAHINGQIPASALTPLSIGGHLLAVPARAFEEWRRQAAKVGRVLTITSTADAYRVLALQERVFLQRYIPQATGGGIYGDVRHYKGVRYVRRHGAAAAVPGTSNHGRGLAIDVANAGPFGGEFHDWLLATGPALGWSNTEGRSVGEPWHWVHNGVTLASAATLPTTGLRPAPPITLPPSITLPEDFLMALTHDQQEEALRILRNLNAQVTGADGQHPSIASRVIAIEGQVTGLPDALAALPNTVWMAPVTGADPATGALQTHPAASWVTVAAFRIAAGQSAAAIADAIPADIARDVVDELTRRLLKG